MPCRLPGTTHGPPGGARKITRGAFLGVDIDSNYYRVYLLGLTAISSLQLVFDRKDLFKLFHHLQIPDH